MDMPLKLFNSANESSLENQSRRQFIKACAASGALIVGAGYLPITSAEQSSRGKHRDALVFNAFVKITPDNRVVVVIKHLDKGQGVTTGLATIVAEEMDANWSQVGWEFAPADATKYNNLFWGPNQGTGGSTAIANSWQQLRNAGAAARAMFVNAAAKKWGVDSSAVTVSDGFVKSSTHRASFGELIELALKEQAPETPTLKSAGQFRLIGKKIPRIDSPEKTTGQATYTQDIQLENMLTALVLYPPQEGGVLVSFDDSAAKKIDGFHAAFKIPKGLAVLATSFWAAKKARDAVIAKWDLASCETRSSEELFKNYRKVAEKAGTAVTQKGDVEKELAHSKAGEHIVEALYQLPYLAHATMEPMNCVALVGDSSCELWFGSQSPTMDQHDASQLLGIAPEKVVINTLFAGGSFGRRACPNDYVVDAIAIARQIKNRPVKMVWTREDDMLRGKYRPMAVHKVRAKVSSKGGISAWHHHSVAQAILRGTPLEGLINGPVEGTLTEGIHDLPYSTASLRVEGTELPSTTSGLWWRSVGHSGNAFAVECFVDQLAHAVEKDPLEFRRALLQGQSRYLGVLNLLAEKADWSKPLPKGHAKGIAVHKAMGSWVAQLAEVSFDKEKNLQVDRVVCAVDCGIAINPDIVKAQMEGSIGFALGAVFGEQVTLEKGVVNQKNFDAYTPLRFSQMPKVEVHIVPSAEPPTGVGEPGVPPLTPAVANAVFALTGKPVYSLPIEL
ncbi:isoquinoline 1-oxidoreductase, beta subunit [Alteromonadaceae bacterium Bs31]|nr:isoquinoline 1-oxidoreductase, beta subunit [Alteromonadaceae bacterium Bs31]